MLSLKRQLQSTKNEPSETTSLGSLSTVTSYKPLSAYSLYSTTTTSSSSFLHSYPSTLSYYGNSSYSTGSSYTYSSQPSYGGLLLGKSESTSHGTSGYGFTMTTTSEISGLNFGHNYQTSITTTSPLLPSTSSKLVTTVTTKNKNQVTIDTMDKDNNKLLSTEATLVLPGLVDDTKMSFQAQPKPTTAHGE